MLIDASDLTDGQTVTADICVIGAGPAGISLANEFLGTSASVCVLESGGLQVEADTQALAGGTSGGQRYVPLQTTRLRMFGGTSGHWGGWCRPLDRIDFRERPWIPHSGWPLTRDVLDEYYARAQGLFDVGPNRYRLSDWFDVEERCFGSQSPDLSASVIQVSPTRFGEKYRDAFSAAENLTVILHANVLAIDTDPGAGHVSGLQVAHVSGRRFSVVADRYVVAAGGLENPRLLLLSDHVQPEGLGNGNDNVGRYFMNHTFVPSGSVIRTRPVENDSLFTEHTDATRFGQPTRLQAYLTLSERLQEREEIANVSFNLAGSDFSSALFGFGGRSGFLDTASAIVGNLDEVIRGSVNRAYSKLDPGAHQPVYSIINITEQTPNPDSRVTLSDELDGLGQRRLHLDWRLKDIDLRSMARGQTLLGAELARYGMGRVMNDVNLWDGWPNDYIGDWHHMGTTRMSVDPADGVVDLNCRVHGIDNLYVAGSSVFPTGGYSNPTLTIVALALRLADHFKTKMYR